MNESQVVAEYETLLQLLYMAPVGLMQTTLDGTVEIINPMSASLLMPLSRTGNLDNLFDTLDVVAPQLRRLAADFDQPSGVVCEALRVQLTTGPRGTASPVLWINLVKLDATHLMAMLSDVTLDVQREQLELARGLNDAARTDRLTRMPNRMVVRDTIQQALDRGREGPGEQFAVLFMNCDRFTQINDRLGHAVGDEVLGLVADRLRSALRQRPQGSRGVGRGDTAARTGSDEFVVFIDHLRNPDDVFAIARRLLDALGTPYVIGAHELHCSVSIGIVLQAAAARDADVVLQDASIAMMEAKRAGGACFTVFEPAMQERAARLGDLEADLHKAIADRELFVMYQPVVDLQRGEPAGGCAGVEALVRWRHPTRGVVPPFEFIGAAEECGLIGAIGEFVLDTACRQFVQWQHELGARAPRTLAVNLSRAQLSRPGLIDAVREVLMSSGMAPGQLQLEVTESLAAQDKTVQSRLHELKNMGLTLALDDFGTGFSSLACLHLLPVDTVKIDRSFVSYVDTSRHHHVLIQATVLVANSSGMSTVAEGIETEAQAAVVRDLGCDKGQGYWFSRPLIPADLVNWLEGHRLPAGDARRLTSPDGERRR
jgi:diguanylate cyclase (GGDEF)-like protein